MTVVRALKSNNNIVIVNAERIVKIKLNQIGTLKLRVKSTPGFGEPCGPYSSVISRTDCLYTNRLEKLEG